MKFIILILFSFGPTLFSYSQSLTEIRGSILNANDRTALLQSSIVLYQQNGDQENIVTYTFSKIKGNFVLKANLFDTCSYYLSASHIGYITEKKVINFLNKDSILIFNFLLTPSQTQLQEIVIENKGSVLIKKDTVEFKADSFRTAQTKKVEDLVRNIDGFKVEADGRISYRGKEVKTLLLDGDDLTQDQYQLLTKNLNADIVDRLQVIDNYNKNRIMGGLLESNQAAINLKLKKTLLGKLNGSVAAGASVEGRYDGDLTLVWLKTKMKMVGLVNANNVAKDATGLLSYQQFGSTGSLQQQEELTKKIMNGTGIVSTGTLSAPDISKEYVLNNKNYFASPLFHTKISRNIKLSARLYAVKDALYFEGNNSSQTIIDAQNQWSLQSELESNRKRKNFAGAAELTHDNGKRFAGSLNFQAGRIFENSRYLNQTSGFFTDTLSEKLKANRSGYAAVYNGAVKLNEKNVLNIQSNFSSISETKDFDILTGRLHLLYALTENFKLFEQGTEANVVNWQTSFSLYNKKGTKTIMAGIENNLQQSVISNTVNSNNINLNDNYSEIVFSNSKMNLAFVKKLNEKSSVKLNASAGIGAFINKKILGKEVDNFAIWKLNAGYNYKIKAFSGLHFTFTAAKEFPAILMFHPATIISSNASVHSGAIEFKPAESYLANISFSSFKIISKFSLLVSGYYRYDAMDYTSNLLLMPQYENTIFSPVKNNTQTGLNFDIGSFVFPLNSTLRLSSFASYSINNQLLNNIDAQNKTSFGGFTATWIPSFKQIPFLWQVDFGKNFVYNTQYRLSDKIKNSYNTTNVLLKVRSNFKGKYYIGSQYNFLQLSPASRFHLWSIFQNYSVNDKCNFDLLIHNVLNNLRYVQQLNTPNSQNESSFVGVGRYILLKFNWSF